MTVGICQIVWNLVQKIWVGTSTAAESKRAPTPQIDVNSRQTAKGNAPAIRRFRQATQLSVRRQTVTAVSNQLERVKEYGQLNVRSDDALPRLATSKRSLNHDYCTALREQRQYTTEAMPEERSVRSKYVLTRLCRCNMLALPAQEVQGIIRKDNHPKHCHR